MDQDLVLTVAGPQIAKKYTYLNINFGPFIWIFAWIVSLLLVRPLKF